MINYQRALDFRFFWATLVISALNLHRGNHGPIDWTEDAEVS